MIQADQPRLVLASASATRRALLERAGLRFEAQVAGVDEAAIKQAAQAEGIPPADAAIILAEAKAERIARRDPEALVIGSDQLLVCEGRWFDKPDGIEGARAHLRALSGKRHELVNGTVARRGGERVWQDVTVARLTMRDLSDDFIETYLRAEGDAVCASVGAYRVEALGVHLFSRIEAEHSAILGLPMLPLLRFLRQHRVVAG